MNGRVANSTFPARRPLSPRNLRTLLLAAACALSLALLGAVRLAPQLRPDPLMALSQAPVVEWDETAPAAPASPDEPLVPSLRSEDELVLSIEGLPPEVAAVPLRAPALPLPAPRVTTPTIRASPPAPTLTGPRLRTMLMEVTAYCPCPRCCGPRAQGITASGRRVSYNGGKFVAADTKILKFNTKLVIPGYANGRPVEVIDRGGAIKGDKLDVYFPTHQEARKWGRQKLLVTVIED